MASVFDKTLTELRTWKPREPVDHRKLNEAVNAINDLRRGAGVPAQILERNQPMRADGTSRTQFRVRTDTDPVRADTIQCWRIETDDDGNLIDGEPTTLLKPWDFRLSTHPEGKTWLDPTVGNITAIQWLSDYELRVRAFIEGRFQERTWIITPMYWQGVVITGERVVAGDFADVDEANLPQSFDPETGEFTPIRPDWIDANHSGRQWSELPESA